MRRSRSWITMREFWSWKRTNEAIKPCREYERCVATCASSHLFDHVSDFPLLAFQHVVQMVDLLLENGNLLLQLLCPEQRHTRNWRWVRRHGWFLLLLQICITFAPNLPPNPPPKVPGPLQSTNLEAGSSFHHNKWPLNHPRICSQHPKTNNSHPKVPISCREATRPFVQVLRAPRKKVPTSGLLWGPPLWSAVARGVPPPARGWSPSRRRSPSPCRPVTSGARRCAGPSSRRLPSCSSARPPARSDVPSARCLQPERDGRQWEFSLMENGAWFNLVEWGWFTRRYRPMTERCPEEWGDWH